MSNPFIGPKNRPRTQDGIFDESERGLANRNSGTLLETLALDITPLGTHYLLTHFDTPIINSNEHLLHFGGAFKTLDLDMEHIRSLPRVTMPVTLECSGNGRTQMSLAYSMPWAYEAAGTSEGQGPHLPN